MYTRYMYTYRSVLCIPVKQVLIKVLHKIIFMCARTQKTTYLFYIIYIIFRGTLHHYICIVI